MPKQASPNAKKVSKPVTTELLTQARQQLQSWLPRESTLDLLSADIDAATTRGASHQDVIELLTSLGFKVSIYTFRQWLNSRIRDGKTTA